MNTKTNYWQRDRHPALSPHIMQTKGIVSITLSEHGTILVKVAEGETLDLLALENVRVADHENNELENAGYVVFVGTHYHTEEQLAKLEKAFQNDEYDDLGPDCVLTCGDGN